MFSWTIVDTVISLPNSLAWMYYGTSFGRALLFDFLDVGVMLLVRIGN